ncbi:MAG: hypothetical protein IJ007_00100 [Oscillospiraceae bacterium]|nr:hypothetical protein [Oscillospiraceae bacterium]
MATFYNQATLSHNGNVSNSNITTGELLEVLSVSKTAVDDEYWLNDENTYVVSIINSGSASYANLTVTDDLGAYPYGTGTRVPLTYVEDSVLYYVNGVLQSDPTVANVSPLTITGISVPAGGNAILVYAARANSFAPLEEGSEITNTVTAAGCGVSAQAQETVTARTEADLTISKSLNPTVIAENGRLTYTFVIQNYGNTPVVATDDTVITDTFDPILSALDVTFNGTQWTAGVNYSYNTATGLFATAPNQITVPAATYTQDASGAWVIQPGVSVLTVSGTI